MAFAKEIACVGISPLAAVSIGGQANTALEATGSLQTDAATINASNVLVTGADGTTGVILPACQPGESCIVFNNSASTLKVYPPTGAAIAVPGTGLGSANASYAHTTYANCKYSCVSSTQWLVNKSA